LCVTVEAQPAKGANKFLGNITTRGSVRSDYGTFWNQITPENESKWESVERTRDQMSWRGVDAVSDYAKTAGIPWKYHTLLWGSQFPSWMSGLSAADQLAEIEELMDAAAERYPNVEMIDVINEAAPGHKDNPPWKNALGGNGSSGYDWILKAFVMARERWPNAILIYNDYNNIEISSTLDWTVKLAAAAKAAKAPVDAIGIQAHGLSNMSGSNLKSNLDKMAATGLPLLISEFDIASSNDAQQANKYKELIPVMWEHPAVAGITLWGYLNGATWISGSGILNSDGTERPAMTWLKGYIAENKNPPNTFPKLLDADGVSIRRAMRYTSQINPNQGKTQRIFDLSGKELTFMSGSTRTIRPLATHDARSGERALFIGLTQG
jgi:endo-1,4-beta-xylanase